MQKGLQENISFAQIVEKYSDMVTRLSLIRLQNYSDAEDCYQNVFYKLYKSNIIKSSHDHIKAWLIKVTINECNDIARKFWRKNVTCIDEIIVPIHDTQQRELVESIFKLPQIYREVIYLHYYEGYKVEELSQILKRKVGTIKSQLNRGRELLKSKIGDDYNEKY